MPLGIDGEPEAGLGQRAFLADAGDDIAERPALRRVIMHVVDGDERRAEPFAELGQQAEPPRLVAAMIMNAGEEGAAGRCASQSREALDESVCKLFRRQSNKNLAFAGIQNLLEGQVAFAFL